MSEYKNIGEFQMPNTTAQKLDEKDAYLYYYEHDVWAEKRMEDEIKFDWNKVCRVRKIEIDEEWDKTPIAQNAKKQGYNYMMVICECPNPKHGIMRHIMRVPPTDFDEHCPTCISEEMYRVISLRAERDVERKREEKERGK